MLSSTAESALSRSQKVTAQRFEELVTDHAREVKANRAFRWEWPIVDTRHIGFLRVPDMGRTNCDLVPRQR